MSDNFVLGIAFVDRRFENLNPFARRRRAPQPAISSSDFPENIGPQITSIHPLSGIDFLKK